ncbi:unnamed protein product, partial [Lymnaea stagnalis]
RQTRDVTSLLLYRIYFEYQPRSSLQQPFIAAAQRHWHQDVQRNDHQRRSQAVRGGDQGKGERRQDCQTHLADTIHRQNGRQLVSTGGLRAPLTVHQQNRKDRQPERIKTLAGP